MLKALLKKNEIEEDYIEVIIEGDCNDADYNTTIREYDAKKLQDEDFLKALYYINYIGNPREDCEEELVNNLGITIEEAKELKSIVFDVLDTPSDDYDYCHTIEYIEVFFYKKDGTKYNVVVENILMEGEYD